MLPLSSSFTERHRLLSLTLVIVLLIITGVLLGVALAAAGVHAVDALVGHLDPGA